MARQYGGKPVIKATDEPRTLKVAPLQATPKRVGRPPAVKRPEPPAFEWQSEYEHELYEWFIDCIERDYPNMKDSDKLLLPLAAAEYVKWMRLLGNEIKSGELVTQARQHPGQMFSRLLDSVLGTTRKQRVAKGDDKDKDELDLMELLSPSAA